MSRRCNGGDRGNTEDRRRRREWLVETYRANWDAAYPSGGGSACMAPFDTRVAACRCFRCGKLLTVNTLTVDRIIPGIKGGTYRRNNIRPACASCNTETGNELKAALKAA